MARNRISRIDTVLGNLYRTIKIHLGAQHPTRSSVERSNEIVNDLYAIIDKLSAKDAEKLCWLVERVYWYGRQDGQQ